MNRITAEDRFGCTSRPMMIGFTLAIGDFMTVLAESALWTAGGIALQVAAGVGVVGGGYLMVKRIRKRAGR